MRSRALLLLLVVSCGRAEDASRVQDLLSRTPIPLDRLRDALEIKPGEVEILGGDAPGLFDPAWPPLWAVLNRGTRPLWLHRDDLTLHMIIDPLLEPRLPPRMRSFSVLRPVFNAADWILLRPLEQAPLRVPEPGVWGRVQWIARIGDAGHEFYAEAESFNAKTVKLGPEDWSYTLVKGVGETAHLPPFSWDGSAAGPAPPVALDVRAVDGELVWETEVRGERPTALALWAYVLSDDRRLLYQGRLDSVSHRSGGGRLSTRYVVPGSLPPGTHRLLAMGQYAGDYLSPGSDRRGVSRWIPWTVEKK